MVSVSNHEVGRVEPSCATTSSFDMVSSSNHQDEVYWA